MPKLTDRQQTVYDTYNKCGCSDITTAKKLGVSKNAVRKNLYWAARKGYPIAPDQFCPQAPAGFGLTKSTIQINDTGDIVQRWDRVSPDADYFEKLMAHLEARVPACKKVIPAPKDSNPDLMLEWKLMDHHFGLYSYAQETGADYDVDIAKDLVIKAAERVFSISEKPHTTVIVLGGDNMHMDNRSNQTEKSHNILDVDTRFDKVIDYLISGMTTGIDIALQTAQHVEVVVLPGNHDWHGAKWLIRVLKAHYRNNPRLHVDTSYSKHKFFRWGSNYFMYSHGDTGSKRLAAYMLNHIINSNLTGIKRKYVRLGHLHKRGKKYPPGLTEEDGVIIEYFPTLTAPDSFSAEHAYSQTRATQFDIFHKEYGRRGGAELCVEELIEEAV